MRIGIIGGGINGLCCAWEFLNDGHSVELFERDTVMAATSRSSSKLLHGGLRYLETGEFRLVREALRERDKWLKRAPELTSPLRLLMPIYKEGRRSRWQVALGLYLYDRLGGRSMLPKSRWLKPEEVFSRDPDLRPDGLLGAYEYSDGQMDDLALGKWVESKVLALGAVIHENTEVAKVSTSGLITTTRGLSSNFDRVINVAGPWTQQLLEQSCIISPQQLQLVRGSHLILDTRCHQACILEVPNEKRVVFALPWKNQTLLGTTEIPQSPNEPIACSKEERDYLISAYKHYWRENAATIVSHFSGVRPLIKSTGSITNAPRDYAVHKIDKLVSVFGGKWTTAPSLARRVRSIALL